MQRQGAAVRRGVDAVFRQMALDASAALVEMGGEGALHQAEPVAIDRDLVLGIDGGDAVLAIDDGGDGGLDDDVGDAGGIIGADAVGAVDDDLDMQAVIDQQHRGGRQPRTAMAGEAR